jgi:hypothetical protein
MPPPFEETLDPADWGELRALGHRMVDDMMDYLEGVRERPVWRPVPAETREALDQPTPRGPTDPAEVYRQFREHVLPYPNGNIHPRFWGWVMGTGTPLAMLADMLASGMNPHLAGYDQSPVLVERQVIRWMADLLGFPAESSGLLVSGGTVANLLGLAVARNARAGFDLRAEGLQRPEGLSIAGGPDFLGIATWIFDVYLNQRLTGASTAAAWTMTENAIRATDEWRSKH